ncbi:RICIN domain-containing protein [Streptomyces sp. NPDC045431]|uniref:RICIN domain-containing protein n=1 Tax=Streptomyces sp. NPDC045431 TaxID=3155613 RepID=UPI0033F01260
MTAAALLGGLAVQPDVLGRTELRAAPASATYDWNEDTPAEQLRQDQCLMAEVLRLGGPAMATVAQDGLNQPQEQLHALANRQHWEQTPLAQAYAKDRAAVTRELKALETRRGAWGVPLEGLETPGGFTVADFHSPPGAPGDGKEDFHSQTGLAKWIAERFWKEDSDFYRDSTPLADEKTAKAVKELGAPLYGKDPDPQSPDWNRDVAERDAFARLVDWSLEPTGADNARLFLASGGFPRTAPAPGSAEFRIGVEDLKARFASCAWRDPIDPNKVLGTMGTTAAAEWQEEIASQATQRDQILAANKDATQALATGAKAMGELLGRSWIADHLAQWQDYWSPGGLGWIGDSPAVIEVPAAPGKCLDVAGGASANGTPVQIYTCNGSAGQKWLLEGGGQHQRLRGLGSQKCLEVAGGKTDNGAKIQIATCNESPAQTWEYNPRAKTALKNAATGKCVDLHTYDNGRDAWQWACNGTGPQQFTIKPSGSNGADSLGYPDKAQFDKAKRGIVAAQATATRELAVLKAQAAVAKKAVTASDAAEQAAYAIADQKGAPRGRGLLVGQQKAQVTKGAAAALEALVKAGETAEAATRASAGDSATIAQRALAQAAQSKAEFRKEAAHAAELQAKAAADAAKVHRDNAKKDKETAEAKLAEALKAEGDAKAAAADAHAKRLAAEAEEKTAEKEMRTAAAKQAEAAQHRETAETEAGKAKDAKDKAESAEATAVQKKNAAVTARDKARDLRDDAWDAEQKADAARAKADAKEAYAQAHESDANAQEARAAADAADKYATDAETAAKNARGAADAATQAAADADAAATRAESAAKRARADADAAQAAKLRADAAVKTATSAAADAIAAAQHAAAEARAAVKLADEAEAHAKTAKNHADEANKEAAKALAAAAKAAGFAHVTARAAVDAGKAAGQVAKPANDAIQLGSPYVTKDSAAGLVVLTGQASKSIAEQQKAVADAHAKNAQEEAAAAMALAQTAQGDAKAAYQHAANAANHASQARTYAKEALGYAADAALAASKAAQSLARTVEYGRQAAEDAAAADKAAGRAEGHAKTARDSADQAALDAQAARAAAAAAEQAAKDARAAATRADQAATEAEQAAKDADKYAKEAQEAYESAERKKANEQVATGAGTGIGGMFYVVDDKSLEITDAKQQNDCVITVGFEGCEVTYLVTFDVNVDFFLCTNPDVPATASGCPSEDTLPLGTEPFKGLKKEVTEYFSKLDIIKQTVVYQILKAVLVQDFLDCWHGSASGCAWAASNFIPGKAFDKVADAIRALDAAMNTGVNVRDAFNALKALDELDPATLARIENTVNLYEDLVTSCRINSFPGDTQVLMADGSHKAISEIRRGDRVLAADPERGVRAPQAVTATYAHDTDRLVDIAFADGSRLTSTAGHRVYVVGAGWTVVSELRAGDALRTPDGEVHRVSGLTDRSGIAPRTVFDITVAGLHTFYVRAEGVREAEDVLVHNCSKLSDELDYPRSGAHTLSKHVNPNRAQAEALARENQGKGLAPINTVWTNQTIAQEAVDEALKYYFFPNGQRRDASFKALDNFLNRRGQWKNKDEFPLPDFTWHKHPSLGTVYKADGSTPVPAGNTVRVVLKRLPGQRGHQGFIVYTAYPLP